MAHHTTRSLTALALVIAIAGSVGCGDSDTTPPSDCYLLADGSCVKETFANPPVLEPDGDGVYQLELQPTELTFAGQRHCGRGYNGVYPAPTIETTAQTDGAPRSVRVDLHNGLHAHDYQSINENDPEEVCTCTDTTTGEDCAAHAHGGGGDCVCTNQDGERCHLFDFNVTNLHFHGAHVRPDFAAGGGCVEHDGYACRSCEHDPSSGSPECFFSDDVISRVEPHEGAQHRFDLDEDGVHHAGLSWYHPHIHGSTAIQVAGGAAGAWIVRGHVDEIDGIKNARERVMVLTTPPLTYEPLAEGDPCDEDHITIESFATLNATPGNNAQANLINGMETPRLVMAPGQIERWRILDASFLDEIQIVVFRGSDSNCTSLDLASGPITLTQIGRDGMPLAKPTDGAGWPFAPPYIFMSSGYRVEALLDGGQLAHGDTLCVMGARALQADGTGTTGEPVGTMELPTPEEIITAASNGNLLAIVNVTDAAGPPTETHMPDLSEVAAESPPLTLGDGSVDALARCEEVKAIADVDDVDQLAALWMLFYNTDGLDQCAFSDHNINAKNFELTDRERYPFDRVLELGSVDHWRLVSGFDGHPFHIHINPYLVCPLPPEGSPDPSAKGRLFEPPFAHWRDTYLVNLDRTVDVLTEYRGFAGTYVYHCHKLTHEDHGMMEIVHVCDPEEEACDTLCDGGPCDWNHCAEGDDACERALIATKCLFDPAKYCPEAALRCTPCDADQSCPFDAHCSDVPAADDETRCVPGCLIDDDCGPTERCAGATGSTAGACEPAPACAPPCPPPATCVHGACE